jgi:hypothetical protein
MTTEAEAKTRWCPFADMRRPTDSICRTVEDDRCLGSGCMAWQQHNIQSLGKPADTTGWIDSGGGLWTKLLDDGHCRRLGP